jgi:hypothetical protein
MSAVLAFPLPTIKPSPVSPAELPGFQLLHATDPGFDEPDPETHCQFCNRQIDPESDTTVETKQPMDEMPGHHWLDYYCSDDCHAKACVLRLRLFDRNGNPTATIRFARHPRDTDPLFMTFPDAQLIANLAVVCGCRVQIFDHTGRCLFSAQDKRVLEPGDPKRFWLEAGR